MTEYLPTVSILILIIFLILSMHCHEPFLNKRYKIIAVKRFFSPRCIHCVNSQNDWELFRNKYDENFLFIDIDVTKVHSNVKSVPFILFVTDKDQEIEYSGLKTFKELDNWITTHAK